MKLYTEEQVRKAINDGSLYSYINGNFEFKNSEDDIINALTPIELPSDEEMIKELFYQKQVMNPYPTTEYAYTAYEKGFMDCAKLIIYKILNK